MDNIISIYGKINSLSFLIIIYNRITVAKNILKCGYSISLDRAVVNVATTLDVIVDCPRGRSPIHYMGFKFPPILSSHGHVLVLENLIQFSTVCCPSTGRGEQIVRGRPSPIKTSSYEAAAPPNDVG